MGKIRNLQYAFFVVFFLISFYFPWMVTNAEPSINPTDIQGHWAAKQIIGWTSKGLIGGYPDGTFKPNNKITRAEFIALVNRAFGYTKTSPISFSDVVENDWYVSEIAKAKAVGYIGGYLDGTIKPNNPISRQEVAVILTRILKPKSVPIASTIMFADAKDIPRWSMSSIETVIRSGYMGGYPDNTFQPSKSITRAEAISVLDRALGVLYNQVGIYGTEQEITTIAGNVTISKSGVTLKNTVINGNLYLTEGISDGHVTLENVLVRGTTKVSGGGENSIIILNCNLGRVLVDVPDNCKVRLVAQGSTSTGTVEVRTETKLEEKDLTGSGFGEVVITVPQGAKVDLVGKFQEVKVGAPNAKVVLLAGTVDTFTLTAIARGASLNLTAGTSVNTLTLHSAGTVTGEGTLQTANINVNGVSIETAPTTVTLAAGIEAIIAGQIVIDDNPIPNNNLMFFGGGGGGGFSSGGGGSIAAVETIKVSGIGVSPTTLTLTAGEATGTITATITPENASNKDVIWSTSDAAVATVTNGVVTPAAVGTAIITATSVDDGTKTATTSVTVMAPPNNAPIVAEGEVTQTGTATPAVSGETAVVEYTADVSAWFADADEADTLTYAVVSAKDDAEADVSASVTIEGNMVKYAPVAAQASKTVTIVVKANDGQADSMGNVTITITVTAVPQATPIFEPEAGVITFGTTVTISSDGADAIYYTVDGTEPTTESTDQAMTPLVISSEVTVKAIAVKAGLPDSAITSATYTQAETVDLTGLELSGAPVNYQFTGSTYTYEGVRVASEVASITVTPTGTGTITVDGTEVISGTASGEFALEAGVEKTIVVVATESGKAAKTYTIKVTREIAVPQNFYATAGDKAVSLSWDIVPGVASYNIYRSTQSESDYVEIANSITDPFYESTGLEVGKRYYYKVTATAGAMESDFSEIATAVANVEDQGTTYMGDWLLVSNESSTKTESTGTLDTNINSIEQQMKMIPAGLEIEAYRLNPIVPYEPVKSETPPELNFMFAPEPSVLGDTREFYVYNFKTCTHNNLVTGKLAYIGEKVEVWVDNCAVEITEEMAQQMGREFDNSIHPMVTNNFYTESDINSDGKIAILCFDIQDNYTGPGTGYVGGYFWGGDLYSATLYSNQMEMFYLDTFPAMGTDPNNPDVTKAYSILAHEFQHMVNCNRVMYEQSLEQTGVMETWLNEALSMAAEHMYKGAQSERISYYNSSSAIQNGRSLLYWNDEVEVLANYSLSYLFSQYLRTQVEQSLGKEHEVKFFKQIIEHQDGGYLAVEDVIQQHIDAELSFGEFMTNFRVAMMLKADTGYFGFGGETAFDALSTPLYTGGITDLYGGGAVVKLINAPPFVDPGNKGSDVQYRGIFEP